MDSFDKGWFVLQTYSGYENKVKENLLQRAQTYNMLENILRVEIPTQTVQVEKNGKTKEIEENRFPGYVLVEMVKFDGIDQLVAQLEEDEAVSRNWTKRVGQKSVIR